MMAPSCDAVVFSNWIPRVLGKPEGDGEGMKNFAITGVAGYITPRHLRAILRGNGFAIADARPSIGAVCRIRNFRTLQGGARGPIHPIALGKPLVLPGFGRTPGNVE